MSTCYLVVAWFPGGTPRPVAAAFQAEHALALGKVIRDTGRGTRRQPMVWIEVDRGRGGERERWGLIR